MITLLLSATFRLQSGSLISIWCWDSRFVVLRTSPYGTTCAYGKPVRRSKLYPVRQFLCQSPGWRAEASMDNVTDDSRSPNALSIYSVSQVQKKRDTNLSSLRKKCPRMPALNVTCNRCATAQKEWEPKIGKNRHTPTESSTGEEQRANWKLSHCKRGIDSRESMVHAPRRAQGRHPSQPNGIRGSLSSLIGAATLLSSTPSLRDSPSKNSPVRLPS